MTGPPIRKQTSNQGEDCHTVLDTYSVFHFVKLAARKFFGHKPVWIGADQVQVATTEKLLVDCLNFPQYARGIREVAKLLWHSRQTHVQAEKGLPERSVEHDYCLSSRQDYLDPWRMKL